MNSSPTGKQEICWKDPRIFTDQWLDLRGALSQAFSFIFAASFSPPPSAQLPRLCRDWGTKHRAGTAAECVCSLSMHKSDCQGWTALVLSLYLPVKTARTVRQSMM